MKVSLPILILALTAFASDAAHLLFDIRDFTTNRITGRQVIISPTSVQVAGSNIYTLDAYTFTTTGQPMYVSNVIGAANYRVKIGGWPTVSQFTILVPNVDYVTNMASLIVSGITVPSGSYSAAVQDSRFVFKAGDTMTGQLISTNALMFTPTISGAISSNKTIYTAGYTGIPLKVFNNLNQQIFTVSSNGYVGIGLGAGNPTLGLQVNGSVDSTGEIEAGTFESVGTPTITFTDSSTGPAEDDYILIVNTNYLKLINSTDSRTDIAIGGTGLVGVGTNLPIDTLDIAGSIGTATAPGGTHYTGLTATRIFWSAASSGGAVTTSNYVAIVNGLIVQWTQTVP